MVHVEMAEQDVHPGVRLGQVIPELSDPTSRVEDHERAVARRQLDRGGVTSIANRVGPGGRDGPKASASSACLPEGDEDSQEALTCADEGERGDLDVVPSAVETAEMNPPMSWLLLDQS